MVEGDRGREGCGYGDEGDKGSARRVGGGES